MDASLIEGDTSVAELNQPLVKEGGVVGQGGVPGTGGELVVRPELQAEVVSDESANQSQALTITKTVLPVIGSQIVPDTRSQPTLSVTGGPVDLEDLHLTRTWLDIYNLLNQGPSLN
jgi:hypothetical protein